ncbi:MAG: DUF2851 family protein [Kiritimatiellia bacterium]
MNRRMNQPIESLYEQGLLDDVFPRAKNYRIHDSAASLVRENHADESFTERHLQCIWFDPALRPAELKTSDGESVRVEHPGNWNLEAGPDFLRAAILVGNSRRIEGDAEIHIHPADWNRHGHRGDPRYRKVRIHVTFYSSGTADLPAGCIGIALQKPLQANPVFSFEQIDLAAYPFAARGGTTACAEILCKLSPEAKAAMLDAAGEERLRQKSIRFAHCLSSGESEQILYREVMGALGYKHNSQAFRTLAGNVPLDRLREACCGNALAAYAILLGCAGLLPKEPPRYNLDAQIFVRQIWDCWWKTNSQWTDSIMPASSWRLAGLRPANHPARRLMAAAHLFTNTEALPGRLMNAAGEIDGMLALLTPSSGTFWDHYLSLNGRKQKETVALIGDSRAAAIITNIFIPWLAARSELPKPASVMLDELPCDTLDSTAKMTAHNLFGPVHNPRLYNSGLRRQGLLQIFHDFCVQDRSNCSNCKFPETIKRNFRS